MDVKEAIMQVALDKFKNELSNPNSPVAKKFNTMLYGDPTQKIQGLFDKLTEYADPSNEPRRDLDDELRRYKRTPLQAAGDIAGTAIGTIGKGAGDTIRNTGSIIGDALMSLSRGPAQGGIQNPLAPVGTLIGGTIKAGSNLIGGTTGMLGEAISAVTKDIRNNREKERETELLLREHPNGAFYDARRKLTTGVQQGYNRP